MINDQENPSYLHPGNRTMISSLSPEDYKQFMMSSIGTYQPSRNSIVRFLDNPQDSLEIENLQSIFDEDDSLAEDGSFDDESTSSSSFSTSYVPETTLSSNKQDVGKSTFPTPSRCYSHEISHYDAQQTVQNIFPDCPSELSDSLSFSSRAGVFLLPDSYAEPVDVDLFSDLSEEPITRSSNKRGSLERIGVQMDVSDSMASPTCSLLHQACYLYPKTLAVVNSAITLEKSNLRKRIATPERTSLSGNSTLRKPKRRKRNAHVTLPLHIAIECCGSFEVIHCLAKAAPDVIAWKDGPNDCSAISALLYQKRFDHKLVSSLLQENPITAIGVVDRYQNTSLHVACAQGAPLGIISMLHEAFPKAVEKKNILGLTPPQVAQQMNLCSIDVIDFLQEIILIPQEQQTCDLMDQDNAFQS